MHAKRFARKSPNQSKAGIRLFFVLLIALASIGTGLTVNPKPTYACSCAIIDTEQASAYAHAIFSGTVVDRRESPGGFDGARSSADPVYYVFEVDKAWKGDAYETTTVSTAMSSASCGTDFKMGENYLVFAREDEDRGILTTSLCSGNEWYESGIEPAAVQELGKPVELRDGVSPGSPEEHGEDVTIPAYVWWTSGILVLLIAALAFALYRRRSRVK
ncbi:hypothetical protein [Saccharibacillus kuerlensis]|uniref:Tissue inhibitor of metalloproteinase n=1 Tax=Saccharibacillus kuerlensis TaxID=459527 RepID=A0ABQ2KRH5_9BACL|nr:hypothetical protein [Saccharibacillus kuerlensis]GGN91136.1 hypothetical protein GCM10010969_02430 [Saccharibacillus kuerlensis]